MLSPLFVYTLVLPRVFNFILTTYLGHIKAVHQEIKDFICKECNFTTSIKQRLSNHMKSMHQDHMHRQREFKSNEFSAASDEKGSLATHLASVHQEQNEFRCNKCLSTFGLKSKFIRLLYSMT